MFEFILFFIGFVGVMFMGLVTTFLFSELMKHDIFRLLAGLIVGTYLASGAAEELLPKLMP